MTLRACVLVAVLAGWTFCPISAADSSLAELRGQASKAFKAGNYRDAWEIYRKLAIDPNDDERLVGSDLQTGIQCLQRLAREDEVDAFRETVIGLHQKNWRLLQAAADTFYRGVHHGFLIAGKFYRGNHRGGGEAVTPYDRDRVRALQLMQAVLGVGTSDSGVKDHGLPLTPNSGPRTPHGAPLFKNDPDHEAIGAFFIDFANQIFDVGNNDAWKLQALTDLSKLPDYKPGHRFGWSRFGGGAAAGAPVDAAGNPVFYQARANYESAKSDGERWLWALKQAVEFLPAQKNRAALIFADFLHTQFGVQTLVSYGSLLNGDGDDPAAADAPFAVHTLKDDETMARLASGIKRFKLPDEFNFLRLYHEVAVSGKTPDAERAQIVLARIYEDRRQYPAAAEQWRECIRRFGPGPRDSYAKRLEQIVGNWGQFEPTSTEPAVAGRTLGYRFRNAKHLDLEAHEIRIDKLLDDVKEYLKTSHDRFDWNQVNIANLGYRLVQQNESKYLGSRVAQWSVSLEPRSNHFDRQIEIAAPLQKAGAYLVTAKIPGGNTSRVVLWLADTVLVRKPLARGFDYFAADAVTGQPVAGANVEFFGYQQRSQVPKQVQVKTIDFAEVTDADGQVIPDQDDLKTDYQWITIARGKEGRLAFLGFEGIWWSDQSRESVYDQNKAFAITDRPVYRPGQAMKFKFWARNARYDAPPSSPFAGQKFKIRVTNPRGETAFEKTLTADSYGGFDGDFTIPSDASLGQYYLAIVDHKDVSGGVAFRVEEYKKPEFEVTVAAPPEPVQLGDKIAATIKANYYFGGPVTQATVHYKITRTNETERWFPYGIWDWLYGAGYWWFWPDYTWYPGWNAWGCARPAPIWQSAGPGVPEVVADASAPIGSDGTLKIAIDTALAKALHGNFDHHYEITAEVVDQSRRTIVGSGRVLAARKPFQVFGWVDGGYYEVGDTIHGTFQAQTLDQKPVNGKGVVTLYRVTYATDGKPSEAVAQTWNVETDADGRAQLQIKASQAGQYRLSYKLTDTKHNAIEGALVLTVRGQGFDSSQFRFNDLELVPDKREYAPGEKVRLLINTNRLDSTVFLFMRPLSNVYTKPQVLRLKGKSVPVEIDVALKDMPNFFVEALTISNGRIFTEVREIVVPPEKRVVNVAVQPSAHDYKPGAKAGVKLKLTDLAGKPIVGSIALAVYDKSVEYISGGSNIQEIRKFFWDWRRFHYPQIESSLARGSSNLLKRGETPMEGIGIFGQLVASDSGTARFGVARGEMDGEMDSVAAVPLWGAAVPGTPVGLPGPHSLGRFGSPVFKSAGKEGANVAPEVQPTVRTQFADTAFWAARLESDQNGLAEVSFPMPENLTTWKVRGWSMAAGTRVGQGEAEIVTTKNLLLRMQAPRFFVETDEVVLSANVHNHLKTPKSVRVVLELDGHALAPLGETSRTVQIAAGGEARVDWRVKAVEHGEATVRMQALTDEESDAMQMHFPVRIHGMLKTEAYAGAIRADRESASFEMTVPAQRRVNDTLLEIRYSPTLAGAMVDALPYLVRYPHDTTDCTLYRFLPTVITQNILKRMHLDLAAIQQKRTNLNAQEVGDAAKRAAGWKRFDENPVFDNAQVDRLVKRGVKALTEMQLADGGWGWFSGSYEHSEPQMTAVIVHGLQMAQQDGVALVPGVLEKGVAWLKQYQSRQVLLLKNAKHDKPTDPYKTHADNLDALVNMVLIDANVNDQEMQDFLYRDRTELSVYAKGMFGLALSKGNAKDRLAMIVQNIDQYLVDDNENQTAWLKLPAGSFWWFWYDSETEANAYYLKLLARTEPKGEKASRLAKYLLNNRKHATYWDSPRDTAIAIEALAEYVVASGEDRPQMTVEVYVDGKKIKQVAIDAQNLFTFDNKVAVAGDALAAGVHKVEVRKRGSGPLYINASLTNFTVEDFITHAGLEIKVARKYFKLVRADETTNVAGSRGQVGGERVEKYRRVELTNFGEVKSGDLLEIELAIDSKNDYEHLIFEDPKAAGVEPFDVQSGYQAMGLPAYVELRDEKVTFFVRTLARGQHSLRYRMRAEIPGRFSALPTIGSAMYAPELRGNSDEMKLKIAD